MKANLTLLTLAALATFCPVQAQTPATAPAAPPTPQLTPAQAENVLKQLSDLEKSIMQQRGTSLGSIIQKLRTAASSDAAAINFIEECDKLVNVERKDGDRDDARKIKERAEQVKRGETKKEEEKEGDLPTALRLCLEYLAISLEAADVKDLASMTSKIQSFHQSLISHGKKLHGKAGDMIMRPLGGGGGGGRRAGDLNPGLVVEAYQLDRYLHREGWPLEPGNIIRMYERVLLKPSRDAHKEDIGSLWDTAITSEGLFRKARMTEGEFAVWQQQEVPALRWQRATDLFGNGPNPVTGMAEMLKVIKDNPNHPLAPTWVNNLRDLVKQASGAEKPASPAP
jgi:hypothetical protein